MQSCKFSTKANSFYLILEISRTTDLTMNAVSHSWQFRDPKFEFGSWTLSIWTCYLQKTKTLTCQIKTRSFTKNHRPHIEYNSLLSLHLLGLLVSDGSNYVWSSMFDHSKPKMGCLSSITNRWTCSSSFDVRKNDVRVSSMKKFNKSSEGLLSSMFDVHSFEAKNRVFEFDHQ